MREVQIQIEPFAYIALQKLTISQSINQHGEAKVSMRIKDEWKEAYLGTLMKPTWVRIMGKGEEGGEGATYTVLFNGLVTDFAFGQNGYETILELQLNSGTILMDRQKHFRVFQNEEADCMKLYQGLTLAYPKGQVKAAEEKEEKTEGVLIQYQETDWQFLKRLASRTGRYLVPMNQRKGCGYTLGLPTGREREMETQRIRQQLNMGDYLTKQENGLSSLSSSDMVQLVLNSREIYQLGDRLSWQGKEYCIYQIETAYDGAECVHSYYLKTKAALQVVAAHHEGIGGASFSATITNVQKDKVQVEIEGDEWKAADGKKWFLYSTVYSSPDGTGWYCMPEIGDMVRVYFPSEKEKNAYAISSVHLDVQTNDSRSNPDIKSISNAQNKQVVFAPDGILIQNTENMYISLNDENGITIVSDLPICIHSDMNIALSAGENIEIGGARQVAIKQGECATTIKEEGAPVEELPAPTTEDATILMSEGKITVSGVEFRLQENEGA